VLGGGVPSRSKIKGNRRPRAMVLAGKRELEKIFRTSSSNQSGKGAIRVDDKRGKPETEEGFEAVEEG